MGFLQLPSPGFEPLQDQVSVQVLVVEGIPVVLEAVDTAMRTLGRAVAGQPLGFYHYLLEPITELLQKSGSPWHRVVEHGVDVVAVGPADDQHLQVFQLHIEDFRPGKT